MKAPRNARAATVAALEANSNFDFPTLSPAAAPVGRDSADAQPDRPSRPAPAAAEARNRAPPRRFPVMKRHVQAQVPRGRRGKKPDSAEINQATADDFEREGMGVAPKE